MELDMTKGSPSKLITKFIIPIIIGNIFQQLYSMVDTIIVGRFIGVDALAAVGATGSVSFLILGFTQGLTTGFTVLTAQRFGAGDREGMRKSIGSAAILSVIVTIVMTAVSMAGMDSLLRVMNTPEDIIMKEENSRGAIRFYVFGWHHLLFLLTSDFSQESKVRSSPVF